MDTCGTEQAVDGIGQTVADTSMDSGHSPACGRDDGTLEKLSGWGLGDRAGSDGQTGVDARVDT